MKIKELVEKKIIPKDHWLTKAKTEYEDVTVVDGIVKWHNGTWHFGTWKNGIWYSGIWYNGIWKDGTWRDGTWHSGTWRDGTWVNGEWNDGTWHSGTWRDGTWVNGTWKNGTWKKGTWKLGNWHNGIWHSGVWEDGTWKSGTWLLGTWKFGEWHNGTWYNGLWRSGNWKKGIWENGIWNGGIWQNGTWHNGLWRSGNWKNGEWKDGTWLLGTWENGTWGGGYREYTQSKWSIQYNTVELIIKIGCEKRTVDEWDNFFYHSNEVIKTKRTDPSFQLILNNYEIVKCIQQKWLNENQLSIDNMKFITNFNSKELDVYEAAVSAFNTIMGKPILLIAGGAYDPFGNIIPGYLALHSKKRINLSTFWTIFDGCKATKTLK